MNPSGVSEPGVRAADDACVAVMHKRMSRVRLRMDSGREHLPVQETPGATSGLRRAWSLPAPVFAAAWGFAEATLFFVVPDVLLTAVALRDWRRGLVLAAWATAGAVLGGAALWVWARAQPEVATSVVAAVPAISRGAIDDAAARLAADGLWALFPAAVTGVPYKLFVLAAAQQGTGPWVFLLVSIPARGARFVASVAVAAAIRRSIARRLTDRQADWVLAGFWVVLYCCYWLITPW